MKLIEGLQIIENFVTEEEEQQILSRIPKTEPRGRDNDRNYVQRFGSNVPYQNAIISHVIPGYLDDLIEKIMQTMLIKRRPDSVSINEYHPGNQIKPHIDSPKSGEAIVILALAGNCKMHFQNITNFLNYDFNRRALMILQGEARWKWKHSIPPVTETRYSIVFRKGTTNIISP